MAVISLLDLRKKAMKKGMSRKDALKLDRGELEDFLTSSKKNKNGSGKKKVAKKAVKKAVAKKKGARKQTPAAKSASTGKAKRSAKNGAKPKNAKSTKRNSDVGRATIDKLDYSIESDDWKPRSGSPVERIWKSLKKNRDNVDKVFSDLKPKIGDFVHARKNNGEKRSKGEMEATLKYRINRTRFEYAVRTNQHKSGSNRVEYGKGQYAAASKKAARAASRKTTSKKAAGGKKKTTKKR